MADVFVSYKREDRGRVKPIVDALVAEGVSVWWDVGIEGGAAWRQSIQRALERAKCVLVIWSHLSVGPAGEFVHDEASWAKVRGLYLPISIDNVGPPLGFGQVQTMPLRDWSGDPGDEAFAALTAAIQAMLTKATAPQSGTPAPAAPLSGRAAKPKVAVLPFRAPGASGEHLSFAEGIAEDVIIGLSHSRLLSVAPAQAATSQAVQGLEAALLRAELGVDYIVQGQVRPMGRIIRVAAQLTGGNENKVLWSARYDRPIDAIFDFQDEIAFAIICTVEPALIAHEEELAFRQDDANLGAWDLFLRGRWHFWRGRPDDVVTARGYLERALKANPSNASTLSLMAFCCLSDVWRGASPDPRARVAEAHHFAMQAVGLDGSDAFVHYGLGVVLSLMGRAGQAEAEQRLALELNPYLAVAAGELSRLYAFAGRVAEALTEADRAIAASPNDPHVWLWRRSKAVACFVAGRHEEAVIHAADACARRPDYFFLHFLLAACACAAGDEEQAAAALREGLRRCPGYSLLSLKMGHPFANPAHMDQFIAALGNAGWAEASAEKHPALE